MVPDDGEPGNLYVARISFSRPSQTDVGYNHSARVAITPFPQGQMATVHLKHGEWRYPWSPYVDLRDSIACSVDMKKYLADTVFLAWKCTRGAHNLASRSEVQDLGLGGEALVRILLDFVTLISP